MKTPFRSLLALGLVLSCLAFPNYGLAATVSWVGGSGDWNMPANWSSGALPGPDDDVVIDRPGDITVTHSSGTHSVKSILSQESFAISGGSLLISNTIRVNNLFSLSGGLLQGATILSPTNGLTVAGTGGTLDGVVLNAAMLVAGFSELRITNGLTVNAILTVGSTLTGSGRMLFTGDQTLSGSGQVVLNGYGDTGLYTLTGGTLTIAPGFTVHSLGGIITGDFLGNGTVLNRGTILADNGVATILGNNFTNAGAVVVSGGAPVSFQGHWGNIGTIVAVDSTLELGNGQGNISQSWTNSGMINLTNTTVTLAGLFSQSSLNNFQRSGGTILLAGTLDNTSGILDLDKLGSWQFDGGTIRHGTVGSTNALAQISTLGISSGTLDGVVLNAAMLVAGFSELRITNGLTVNAILTVGSTVTGSGRMLFTGDQALSGSGQVVLNGYPGGTGLSALTGGTLTIAQGFTVHSLGGDVTGDFPGNGTFLNRGTILADGGVATILGNNFTNAGAVVVSGGAPVSFQGHWGNIGTIVAVDSTLELGNGQGNISQTWTNSGMINLTNTTVTLGGLFSQSSLNNFQRSGGTISLVGTMDNTGTTLNLDLSGPWNLFGGTIRHGTISGANKPALIATTSGGTLDDVIMNADLDLTSVIQLNATLNAVTLNAPMLVAYQATLRVTGGLVLNNVMTLGVTGDSYYPGQVVFAGSQTLSGTGEIVLNNTSSTLYSETGVLTIGPGIMFHGLGGSIGASGPGAIISQGRIVSDFTIGQIYIDGRFTNSGSVSVSVGKLAIRGSFSGSAGTIEVSGGTLDLGGLLTTAGLNLPGFIVTGGNLNLSGLLDNTGGILNLDGFSSVSLAGGTILSGTIRSTNNLMIGGPEGGVLDGVRIDAPIQVAGGAILTVRHGLVLNSALSIGNGQVDFAESQTLSGTGEVLLHNSSARFYANDGSVLTIAAGLTIHGSNGKIGQGIGTIISQGRIVSDETDGLLNIDGNFLNQGSLAAVVSRAAIATADSGVKSSVGQIDVLAGSTIDFVGSFQFDGVQTLRTQPGATLRLGGNLLGNTQNRNEFSPFGSLVFDGSGTEGNPQLLEVMGQDLSGSPSGFAGNSAYGTIALTNNTYVRLVDQSVNAPGTNAEALYVNSLVVPSRTTLDLNGLHLYVRGTQITGAIIGGSVSQTPDGGPITQGNPSDGAIAVPGQADEWTFFGRAGRMMTVVVDPGSANVLSPYLNFADVRLLDTSTNLLAQASNAAPAQMLMLTDVTLPSDGIYRIQIRAPDNQSASTGNYQVTVWDVTPKVNPLILGQKCNGRIATPYTVDQWTFSAVAGQQVSFELINSSAPGLAFDLRGPNGWIGFSNMTDDSDLLDLPQSGGYTLSAYGTGGQYGMDYAFRLAATLQTDLAIGTNFTGDFIGNGQAQLFRIANPGNQPLRITLQNGGANNRAELYSGFGLPPTRGSFTQSAIDGAGANREILLANAYPGAWYVLVYGDNIPTPGSFTLSVQSGAIFMTLLTPARGASGDTATVQIEGAGFRSDVQVALEGNGRSVAASRLSWASSSRLVADFDLSSIPTNSYQIVARQGGSIASLPFQVISAVGPKFEAKLITPAGIGLNTVNTFYVDYSNTGDKPIVAPLLTVTAIPIGDEDCPPQARFSLDSAQLSRDFWAASGPSAASDKVTFFASGKIPGILLPGETGRVPIYFLGWQNRCLEGTLDGHHSTNIIGWRVVHLPPPSFNGGGGFSFQLLQLLAPSVVGTGAFAEPDQPINWQSLRTNVPPSIPPDAWEAIWQNYTNAAGNTFYSYFGMLQNEVDYLYRLGVLGTAIRQVDDLSAFQLALADGIHILGSLASATDGFTPTRGLRLSFERSFPNSISGRYRIGSLGRGWSHNWEYRLATNLVADVTISGPGGSLRTFKPDLRGGYSSGLGDYGQLISLGAGAFSLQEKGGFVRMFSADGTLEHVSDANGNRIMCIYTGGVLTSLLHSSGPRLDIGYNGQGRIQTVSDPVGRVTQFNYDASGEHLATAQHYDGRVVQYQYSVGNGVQREHALTQIQNPDQTHQYFTYNTQGRIRTVSRDGGAALVTYSYDGVGTIYATDALNNTSRFFLDNRGLLVRTENPKGDVVQMGRDERFNLTGITDPAGRSFQYSYDKQGNVTGITDPLGNRTQFAYYGPLQRMTELTDAKRNPTRYNYDPRGNLLGITYADGSSEAWAYDSCCTPDSWTNRRHNKIDYQYNSTNGLLLTKLYPDGSRAVYGYDQRDNLISASNYAGAITLEYHPTSDRLRRITYPGGQWLEYSYGDGGKRSSMTDQRGYKLMYDYDGVGRLRSITNSDNARVVFYEYDAAGRPARKTLANGVYTAYAYDAAGRTLTLTNSMPNGSVVSFFNYTYDERGRRIGMATIDGQWAHEYDDLGQLTHAVLISVNPQVASQDLSYLYDALGNRLHTLLNGLPRDWTANNLNQYIAAGATDYIFDLDGNLVQANGGQENMTFTYDFENRLVGIKEETNSWQYAYDALGNRATTIQNGGITRFLIDPSGLGNAVGEYDAAGNLTAGYDYGLSLVARRDSDNHLAGYAFDVGGNVQALVAGNGSLANSYTYEPFGAAIRVTETIPNPFQFVGQFGVTHEQKSVNFMRARFFNSNLGRFISMDPIRLRGNDSDLYRYVFNSPVNRLDPAGTNDTGDSEDLDSCVRENDCANDPRKPIGPLTCVKECYDKCNRPSPSPTPSPSPPAISPYSILGGLNSLLSQ